ncbi:MAG TPA: hypothetical protein VJG65_02895 [Patescibacteria group bacterium]|nr:hypothetical protein [Patescibacteria group bacterium]
MKKVFIFCLLFFGLALPFQLVAAEKEIVLNLEISNFLQNFDLESDFYSQLLENNINFDYNMISSEPTLINEFFYQSISLNLIAYRGLAGEIVISVY